MDGSRGKMVGHKEFGLCSSFLLGFLVFSNASIRRIVVYLCYLEQY